MVPRLAFDTNAYRALQDGNHRLAAVVSSVPQLAMPVIVLGELYHGVYLGSRQEQNLAMLHRWLGLPRVAVLYPDTVTAKIFGEIAAELKRAGRPIQQNDMWIAALCKQHDYAIATADKGFDSIMGLEVVSF